MVIILIIFKYSEFFSIRDLHKHQPWRVGVCDPQILDGARGVSIK